jgi:hypothetical protein
MVFAAVALLLHMAAPASSDVSPKPTPSVATAPDPFAPRTEVTRPAPVENGDLADAPVATLKTASLKTPEHDPGALSTVRVPAIEPAQPAKVIFPENMPSRRNWLMLSFAQHGAAAFDAYSTRQAVSGGARESDPFMRPFAQSPAIYAAIQGAPLVLDFAARKMQRSHSNFARRTWWLPQTAATGLFMFSGIHNLNVSVRH